MATKQDTARDLRRLAVFFKGIHQAADDIEAIGSMENATREAVEAREAAVGMRDAAEAELKTLRESIAFESDKAKTDATQTREKATSKAKLDAEAILAKAQDKADELIKQANQHAQDTGSQLEQTRANAQKHLEALVDQSEALVDANANATAQLAAVREEHETLSAALADLKARIGG